MTGYRSHAKSLVTHFPVQYPCIFLLALTVLLSSCAAIQWGYYRTGKAIEDADFEKMLATVTDEGLIGGNDIEILLNGDRIFPAMLKAIADAAETIHLETYIFRSDEISRKFSEALRLKAQSGLAVRVIVDYFGDEMTENFKQEMIDSGIQLAIENPPTWAKMMHGNVRTHRKLLIVDGRIAFTGGIGIDDRWRGNAQDANHWRETQCRIQGPVVSHFQSMFIDSWKRSAGLTLENVRLFPAPRPIGDKLAASVGRTDEKRWSKVREMVLLSLAASRRYYWISSAYFNPDFDSMKALMEAVERGVDVRVMVSGDKIDLYSSRLLAGKNFARLIKAGVKIYEYQQTNMHAKTIVADDLFVTIGSTNICNRAFNYNYESNLVVYDEEIASQMKDIFSQDLRHCVEINAYDWERRPLHRRVMEQAVGVIEGWM